MRYVRGFESCILHSQRDDLSKSPVFLMTLKLFTEIKYRVSEVLAEKDVEKGLAQEERKSTKKLMSQFTKGNIDKIFPLERRQHRLLPDSQFLYQSQDPPIPAPFRSLTKNL